MSERKIVLQDIDDYTTTLTVFKEERYVSMWGMDIYDLRNLANEDGLISIILKSKWKK